ncbi:DUF2232 domain-containing protein [Ferrovibrio sp.]|uniref:DUF2232 domain-containing protein n=1 Tax=Ferrovibrio sp. TaxID=1917215 RepID=UPI001B67FB0D|nr:DUF2232 domain-containing protein [Ferrovibrio sp.]MBP7064878.1 DUF2232 domain-containing protein [Ferrovibrio sp.]
MIRSLVFGGLAGTASALLVMTVVGSPFGMVLGYLAPLPLFFAGLTKGVGAAAAAAAAGTLVSAYNGVMPAVTFALLFGLPALWLVRQALLARPAEEAGSDAELADGLEWFPPGGLVLRLAGWSGLLLALALLATSGHEGGLLGALQPVLQQFFIAMQAAESGGDQAAKLAETAARMMPAVVAVSWLTMLTINGTLAQGLAVLVKQNARPTPHYSALSLPRYMAMGLGGAVLAVMVLPAETSFIAVAATAILAFPYFLQGLAVVHVLANKAPASGLILAAFYAALVVASLLVGILVVGLGLIEEWAGFRRRVAGAGTSRESD